MLVSVCINVYNREDTLRQCLDSIINQTYDNLEIIVVDDASTDNSLNIINEYYLKDTRIRVIKNNQNLGPARSAEIAYNSATGYYLCTVDSDDYIELDCIHKCVENIGNAGLIYTYCRHFGNCNKANARAQYPYSKDNILKYFMVFHFRMFKTELWHKIEPFSVIRVCYDYDLVVKLSEITDFVLLPEYLYWWRRHDTQESIPANKDLKIKEYKSIITQAKIRRGLLTKE